MFTHKNRLLTGCLSVLILAIAWQAGLFEIPTAFAQAPIGTGRGVDGSLGDTLVQLMEKIALLNTFMHVLLLIVLEFLGYLLQADFFNNPAMMEGLYRIWVLSRDIMNILFALMLIAVSFYVIITGKSDKAKEHVVNFVVAVILVNFSWFFPRVIIDVANVVTATVYSVPNAMAPGCQTIEATGPKPCKVITEVKIFPLPAEKAVFCGADPNCECNSIACHKTADLTTALDTMTSAQATINGLAVSFARISVLPKIPTAIPGVATGGGLSLDDALMVTFQVAISIILAFVIQLAVLLPLLGLGIGLFIRIIILWITTAFMPFTFLGYVKSGKLGTAEFGFETDIWKEFIQAAFLPAVVGIPFAVGFVMLSTAATIPEPTGAFPLTMSLPIIAGVNKWWQLMWTMAAVGIIWIGAFKALQKSQIVGKFTERIRSFGESTFSGLAQAPLLLPLPLPGGPKAGVNLGTLVHGPKIISDSIRLAAGGRTGKGAGEIIRDAFGGKATGENPEHVAEKLRGDRENTQKIVEAIQTISRGGLGAADRTAKFDTIRESLRSAGVEGVRTESDIKNLLLKVVESKGAKSSELAELVRIKDEIKNITPKD